jgi:DNA oxidative demethylase
MTPAKQSLQGLELRPGYFDRAEQEALLAAVREAIRQAPLYTPTMPRTG